MKRKNPHAVALGRKGPAKRRAVARGVREVAAAPVTLTAAGTPMASGWIAWAQFMAQAHQRPLPPRVLDEVEVLERDGVPEDEEDHDVGS